MGDIAKDLSFLCEKDEKKNVKNLEE